MLVSNDKWNVFVSKKTRLYQGCQAKLGFFLSCSACEKVWSCCFQCKNYTFEKKKKKNTKQIFNSKMIKAGFQWEKGPVPHHQRSTVALKYILNLQELGGFPDFLSGFGGFGCWYLAILWMTEKSHNTNLSESIIQMH